MNSLLLYGGELISFSNMVDANSVIEEMIDVKTEPNFSVNICNFDKTISTMSFFHVENIEEIYPVKSFGQKIDRNLSCRLAFVNFLKKVIKKFPSTIKYINKMLVTDDKYEYINFDEYELIVNETVELLINNYKEACST